MEVSQRAPTAQPRPVAWNALLRPLGVTIRSDMAYDLLANEVIPLPTDFGRVLQIYPFFIRAQSTRSTPVNQDLGTVVLTWASTIDTTGATKGTLTPLLGSSQATGTFSNVTTIAPTQDFPQTDLHPRLLAVMVTPPPVTGGAKPRGRVVVVGSMEFATDRFVRTAPENLAFTLNAVDWLAQDEELIAIRSKDRRPPPLLFEQPAVREAVKYANLVGLPLVVALVGRGSPDTAAAADARALPPAGAGGRERRMSSKQLARVAMVLGALLLLWGAASLARRGSSGPSAADRFAIPAITSDRADSILINRPADTTRLVRRDSTTWLVNGHKASATAVSGLFSALGDTARTHRAGRDSHGLARPARRGQREGRDDPDRARRLHPARADSGQPGTRPRRRVFPAPRRFGRLHGEWGPGPGAGSILGRVAGPSDRGRRAGQRGVGSRCSAAGAPTCSGARATAGRWPRAARRTRRP